MKIALIVGHSNRSGGALHKALGMNEFQFNSEVVKLLIAPPDTELVIFDHVKGQGVTKKGVERFNPDLIIDLHFNASTNYSVQRAETLYLSEESLKYAEVAQMAFTEFQGISRIRKQKLSYKGVPIFSLNSFEQPVILLEPFFGSATDSEVFSIDYVSKMVQRVLNKIVQWDGTI
jgi:hypothetical protein